MMPRPAGATYFVPGVWIRGLGQLSSSDAPGTDIADLNPDVVSVKVTRVNTGASQYEIVLNNWDDRLPGMGSGQGGGSATTAPRSTPRFKYNSLSIVTFGQRLRVDMRYFPDPVQDLAETDRAAQRWVPMIAGPITDMQFTFSNEEGARLKLIGEDDLRILKQKPPHSIPHRGENERQMLDRTLTQADFPLPIATELPANSPPAFFTAPTATLARAHQDSQTYYDYISAIAEDYDLEFYLEFSDLSDPSKHLELHLRPSRSRVPPTGELRDVYTLTRGINLIDFTPTFKVLDQMNTVTLHGPHRERDRPERVDGQALERILHDELHSDPALHEPQLVPGPTVRSHYYPAYGANEEVINNEPNLDPERARVKAEAKLRKQARQFLTIKGRTIGLPLLRAGVHAEIRGMKPPFDGFYYLTETIHQFDVQSGFTTEFTGRRPGMPLPPYPDTTGGGSTQ